MLKRHILTVFFLALFLLPIFHRVSAQAIDIESKEVEYIMPYSGILPDHPLYFIKTIRDRILDFATRDLIKKANLYLLFSDKRLGASAELAKKGKWSLAISTASKGEKYAEKIPEALLQSKKQGVSPTGELSQKVKLSNEKHRQIIEDLLKNAPQGERAELEAIFKMNQQIAKELTKI